MRALPTALVTPAPPTVAQLADGLSDGLVEGCLDRAFLTPDGPGAIVAPPLDALGLGHEVIDGEKRSEDLLRAQEAAEDAVSQTADAGE